MDISSTLIGLVCGGGFLLLFAGLGAFLIYSSFKARRKAGESQSWPSTLGQIGEAHVRRSVNTDSDGDTSYSYTPVIRYSYRVAEQEYTGDKITFGFQKNFNRESKAQQALARFPVGAQVTVYYDPAKPEDAVLERTAGGSTTSLIVGIIFLVISFCVGCPVIGMILYNTLSSY